MGVVFLAVILSSPPGGLLAAAKITTGVGILVTATFGLIGTITVALINRSGARRDHFFADQYQAELRDEIHRLREENDRLRDMWDEMR